MSFRGDPPSKEEEPSKNHPKKNNVASKTTEYAEWQRPLSGVHSTMTEKLTPAGDSGRCRPSPFNLSTITYKVVV